MLERDAVGREARDEVGEVARCVARPACRSAPRLDGGGGGAPQAPDATPARMPAWPCAAMGLPSAINQANARRLWTRGRRIRRRRSSGLREAAARRKRKGYAGRRRRTRA